MTRYIRLYGLFFKNSLLRLMENRFDFAFRIFPTILGLSANIFVVNFLFSQVNEIAGWGRAELLFLTGTYYVVWSIFFGLFIQNLSRINRYVNKGDLDLFLTKPINSQFYVSVRDNVEFGELATLGTGIYLLVYSANMLNLTINPIELLMFLLLLINGALLGYAVWFIIMTTSFWVGRIPELHESFLSIATFGRFPVSIFQGMVRTIFTFLFPVGIMFTFPAEFLLKTLSPTFIIAALATNIIFLVISHKFWNFALRRYSSASS